jgi:surface antigen
MRSPALLLLLLLAACVAVPSASYDPNLYDANGRVVPPVAAANPAQPECREVQTSVMIGGKPQQATATACRQPDGSWRFTN